jgi:hypothetical protein
MTGCDVTVEILLGFLTSASIAMLQSVCETD